MERTRLNLEWVAERYAEERTAIVDPQCTYQRLVEADVYVADVVSLLERDIDDIRADIGIDAQYKDASEAKIERVFKDRTIQERHLLRIYQSLYSTIKSKQFRETK